MVFIVKKRIKGKEYYYLRESRREKGKVKAITLSYLGKTKKEAEENMKKFLKHREQEKKMDKSVLGKTDKKIENKKNRVC